VDGEVVHALLGLLDQRVSRKISGQVFGLAVDLFQRLVIGTVPSAPGVADPLTRFHGCSRRWTGPSRCLRPDGPDQLVDFFLDAST
jgi:hypothetical protein